MATCRLSVPCCLYGKPPLVSSSRSPSLRIPKKFKRVICRAEFSQEAPLAAAIGASILSSFVFPVGKRVEEESAIVSTDMRIAAMGIISFIPYFNWLSWVFAWLDTGKTRYAVYALLYLLPYLTSNLSISPEESWLPITSIVLGIIHVQLEASIANGDIQTLGFFRNTPPDNFSSKHSMEKEEDNDREN